MKPPIVFEPLTRTDIVRYAGASGDFNPIHHDHAFARDSGLPDVMAHGMLSAGLLASALTRWFGEGSVKRYAVRFKSPVWPGDVLTARCVVVGSSSGELDVEIGLARASGEVVVSGTARVNGGQES